MQNVNLTSKNQKAFDHAVSTAQTFITLFHHIQDPNEEQLSTLAAAHYTLGLQENISSNRAKMYLNSAITLLQGVDESLRKLNWYSLMANACVKRAELLEEENGFATALLDYQKVLEIYETQISIDLIPDADQLLLAQCAISIADLLVSEELGFQNIQHPLFYVNKGLEYLINLPQDQEEICSTLAYAHQIAGIILTPIDLLEATEAFRSAILKAFKTESETACQILSDIYNSLGLLFEQHFQHCPIQKAPSSLNEQAIIYFSMALFFSSSKTLPIEEDLRLVDTVFETIYRAIDPFLPLLSPVVLRDLIDALIFIYYCVSDNSLPNQELCYELKQPDTLEVYAQHIYWLVAEYQRRDNTEARLLEYAIPTEIESRLDLNDILSALTYQRSPNNVHYLRSPSPQPSPVKTGEGV